MSSEKKTPKRFLAFDDDSKSNDSSNTLDRPHQPCQFMPLDELACLEVGAAGDKESKGGEEGKQRNNEAARKRERKKEKT